MAAGTFTVAGQRVRTGSTRRYVAWMVIREFDGVRYAGIKRVDVWGRSDSLRTLETRIQRQGFHSSRYFVVIDTATGEQTSP